MPKSPPAGIELLNQYDQLRISRERDVKDFVAHEMGQVVDTFFKVKKGSNNQPHRLVKAVQDPIKASPSPKN